MGDNKTISALLRPAATSTIWAERGSRLDARQRRAVMDAVTDRIAGEAPMPEIELELAEIESLRHALRAHVEEVVPLELRADAHLRVGVVIDAVVAEAAARRLAWLEKTVLVDPLTGLGNRRSAARAFEAALARGRRHGTPTAVAMVDIVGLKAINDKDGHAAGDATLVSFVDSLRQSMRADDDAFRFGGDEFVVLAPGSTAAELARLFDRVQRTAPAFTVGLAESPADGTTEASLIAAADERMYAERHLGAGALPAASGRRRRLNLITAATALALLALAGPVLAWTRQLDDDDDGRRSAIAITTTTTTTTETSVTTETTSAPPTSAVTPAVGGGTVGGAAAVEAPASTVVVQPSPTVVVPRPPTTTVAPRRTTTTTTTTTIEAPYEAASDRRNAKPPGQKPHKPGRLGRR